MQEKARRTKTCDDPKCQERWTGLVDDDAKGTGDFTFCPFCAEELTTKCSACREPVSDPEFKYCPWCGQEFE